MPFKGKKSAVRTVHDTVRATAWFSWLPTHGRQKININLLIISSVLQLLQTKPRICRRTFFFFEKEPFFSKKISKRQKTLVMALNDAVAAILPQLDGRLQAFLRQQQFQSPAVLWQSLGDVLIANGAPLSPDSCALVQVDHKLLRAPLLSINI